jgi:integrase
MGVELLLEKASSTHPDQVALGSRAGGLRYGDLARAADHRHLSGSWSTTSRFVTPEARVSTRMVSLTRLPPISTSAENPATDRLIRSRIAAVFRRAGFDKTAEAIGVPGLHPHELRHTAASLAIASGANVKLVQQMLGHKSATVTLDQYGHLFGDDLDTIADRLDARAQEIGDARTSGLNTDVEVVNLPTSSDRPAP